MDRRSDHRDSNRATLARRTRHFSAAETIRLWSLGAPPPLVNSNETLSERNKMKGEAEENREEEEEKSVTASSFSLNKNHLSHRAILPSASAAARSSSKQAIASSKNQVELSVSRRGYNSSSDSYAGDRYGGIRAAHRSREQGESDEEEEDQVVIEYKKPRTLSVTFGIEASVSESSPPCE